MVKTRRNLCGGSHSDDDDEGPAPPLAAAPSAEPKVLVGEPDVFRGRRKDLLLKSNKGEEHEEKDDISISTRFRF